MIIRKLIKMNNLFYLQTPPYLLQMNWILYYSCSHSQESLENSIRTNRKILGIRYWHIYKLSNMSTGQSIFHSNASTYSAHIKSYAFTTKFFFLLLLLDHVWMNNNMHIAMQQQVLGDRWILNIKPHTYIQGGKNIFPIVHW